MKVAILLGFSYINCNIQNYDYKLPGMLLDIYTVYKYAINIKCDKILVITDYINPPIDNTILNLIINGIVSSDIINFFQNLHKEKQLLEFTTIENLYNHLEEISKLATHLLFYYSGHAHHQMAMIPKYKHEASYDPGSDSKSSLHIIDFTLIMKIISNSVHFDCKILCIMDCCNSKGLNLPYKLIPKIHYKNKYIYIYNKEDFKSSITLNIDDVGADYQLEKLLNDYWFNNKYVICISSSDLSFASHVGSKFTLRLFKHLENTDIISYISLLFILNYELINIDNLYVQIKSSYPDEYYIQPWIRSSNKLSITYNSFINIFKLNNH